LCLLFLWLTLPSSPLQTSLILEAYVFKASSNFRCSVQPTNHGVMISKRFSKGFPMTKGSSLVSFKYSHSFHRHPLHSDNNYNRFNFILKISNHYLHSMFFRLFLCASQRYIYSRTLVCHTKLDLFLCQHFPMGDRGK
jgi:hypothetical protein